MYEQTPLYENFANELVSLMHFSIKKPEKMHFCLILCLEAVIFLLIFEFMNIFLQGMNKLTPHLPKNSISDCLRNKNVLLPKPNFFMNCFENLKFLFFYIGLGGKI